MKPINSKDYKHYLKKSHVKIIDHATVEENDKHKLISVFNHGGLTAIKLQRITAIKNIFFISERKFRYSTQEKIHLAKINISKLPIIWLENKLVSYFNSIMDSSGVDHFYVYAYEKLVNDMLDLQSRPYSLARDAVSKYKFYLKKKN